MESLRERKGIRRKRNKSFSIKLNLSQLLNLITISLLKEMEIMIEIAVDGIQITVLNGMLYIFKMMIRKKLIVLQLEREANSLKMK